MFLRKPAARWRRSRTGADTHLEEMHRSAALVRDQHAFDRLAVSSRKRYFSVRRRKYRRAPPETEPGTTPRDTASSFDSPSSPRSRRHVLVDPAKTAGAVSLLPHRERNSSSSGASSLSDRPHHRHFTTPASAKGTAGQPHQVRRRPSMQRLNDLYAMASTIALKVALVASLRRLDRIRS